MVFKRKIYEKMKAWKELSGGESALMIEGARRIGKSTIAETFVQNEYEDYILLDFAKEKREILSNFEENIGDLDTFFRNLFLLKGKSLREKQSVIIFDEVQLFPLARQAIKYLVADGRYDYIETGSLISIKENVKDILIPSEEYKLKMYPMDFEEFLWAKGDEITFPIVKEAFEKRKSLGEDIHRQVMQKFRTYMAVGGMPQAVSAFVNGRTYEEIDFVKRNILDLYEDDLKKYDTNHKERASVVFKTIPEQLSNHNSHFKLAILDKKARYERYVDAIDFVAESMMGNACINVTAPEVALEL
ncbi:ATP-binding protein, partial [Emergencia sp. 1XD21-10]|uniref:ATP-binding protein n=1 Tax=Emergencia sp. 1XD21-10 TaxID=2304569 RepID=UPI001379BF69